MDSFSVAAGAVAPLMFFMALGFCVSRKAHFDSAAIANFNKLVFKVFLPANMFAAVYFSDMSKLLDPKLISYAIGGVLGIYLLAYFFVVRLVTDNRKRGAIIQIVYRSNFIILGVPLVENIYGPEAVNMPLMLATIIPPLYNVLAVYTLEKFRGGRMDWRHILWGCGYKSYDSGRAFGSYGKIAAVSPARFLDQSAERHGNRNNASGPDCFGGFFQFRKCGGGNPSPPGLYLFPPGPGAGSISGWCSSLWFPWGRTGDSDEYQYPSLCSGWLCYGPADGQRWRTIRELRGLYVGPVLCDHVPVDLLCESPGIDMTRNLESVFLCRINT